jgi:hypothetical protein
MEIEATIGKARPVARVWISLLHQPKLREREKRQYSGTLNPSSCQKCPLSSTFSKKPREWTDVGPNMPSLLHRLRKTEKKVPVMCLILLQVQ